METQALELLKKHWGHDRFRPLQWDIIKEVIEKRDVLALLPTGGGKSICFQIPALLNPGVTLVISPLIALMKDQVENLKRRKINAEAIYTGLDYREVDRILDNCVYGHTSLLYVSPERLASELFLERVKKMKINLLAVDEAHCISHWGYDFRPSYLQISELRKYLPEVPLIALTATATPEVVTDIQEKLLFSKKNVLSKSFERSNLTYWVTPTEDKENKLIEILKKFKGSAIVYVQNRRKSRDIATWLKQNNISADFYNAGLTPDQRNKKQNEWIEEKTRVMVSTNAFGMGIDKSNVRVVIHYELPQSIEAYFQEAGRAGRDEDKAFAILLFHPGDGEKMWRKFKESYPEMELVRRVYQALGNYYQLAMGSGKDLGFDFDVVQFSKTYRLEVTPVVNALAILAEEGWVSLTEAVFSPARLQITVQREVLYDYQLKNPKLDIVLKAILRNHQGAFSLPVAIRENNLADQLKISTGQLIQYLNLMAAEHILDYYPKKDQPQLFFLKERVDSNNLTFDLKRINFRKKRTEDQIRAMIDYAQTPHCRSQFLLNYFGQKNAKTCGICDFCKKEAEPEEKIKPLILQLLMDKNYHLEEIIEKIGVEKRRKILNTLQRLVENETIQIKGNQVFINLKE